MYYEYKTISISWDTGAAIDAALNEHGREGWKLHTLINGAPGSSSRPMTPASSRGSSTGSRVTATLERHRRFPAKES